MDQTQGEVHLEEDVGRFDCSYPWMPGELSDHRHRKNS
jgi:hypothetical protein